MPGLYRQFIFLLSDRFWYMVTRFIEVASDTNLDKSPLLAYAQLGQHTELQLWKNRLQNPLCNRVHSYIFLAYEEAKTGIPESLVEESGRHPTFKDQNS
ncbi:hypothetical protein AVEN_51953-1 [Araneus ventricosus]|uniref:Uncharacterized protein n=1 Tax=Araneus ventricosus TaxID=182803 RepID=A0A4Y2NLK5_ARAVE|nr:hypothetical protein AVEN_51953-1 [Araneus ventricosus]